MTSWTWLVSLVDLFAYRMFTEGRLNSEDVEALSSDHQFINADWLQCAETLVLFLCFFVEISIL